MTPSWLPPVLFNTQPSCFNFRLNSALVIVCNTHTPVLGVNAPHGNGLATAQDLATRMDLWTNLSKRVDSVRGRYRNAVRHEGQSIDLQRDGICAFEPYVG